SSRGPDPSETGVACAPLAPATPSAHPYGWGRRARSPRQVGDGSHQEVVGHEVCLQPRARGGVIWLGRESAGADDRAGGRPLDAHDFDPGLIRAVVGTWAGAGRARAPGRGGATAAGDD